MSFDPRVIEHADQDLRLIEIFVVVYPQIIRADASAEIHYRRPETFQADALVPLCAEDQRLALFEEQGLDGLAAFFGKDFESAVIENIAVLIDLEERRALMPMAAQQHLLKMLGVPVHAAGYKAGIRAHGKGQRIEGMVDTPKGRRLGDLLLFRRGRILAFGQSIDLV